MSGPPSPEFCLERAAALLVKDAAGHATESLAWTELAATLLSIRFNLTEQIARAAWDFVHQPSQEAHEQLVELLDAWRHRE